MLLSDDLTRAAQVELLSEPPELPQRTVPIRFRKNVPTAWLRLTIREGRNRQVRRMTAAVGHPTLRLVRIAIGPIELGALLPGEWRELSPTECAALKALGRNSPSRLTANRGTLKLSERLVFRSSRIGYNGHGAGRHTSPVTGRDA